MLFYLLMMLGTLLVVHSDSDEGCDGIEIVKREDWEARDDIRHFYSKLPLNHVVIFHTVTRFCKTKPQCIRSVQKIQDLHLDERGWWDIAYSFLVGGDGRIYEGRGWKKSGAFAMGYNTKAIGIAFIGNFNKYKPTDAMLNATLKLIDCGVKKGYLTPIREIHGHRDVSCTESPGDNVYAAIRQWKGYKGGRMPNFNCKPLKPPVIDQDELDY